MARTLLEPAPVVLPASLRACLAVCDLALAATLDDNTRGATHYLTERLYVESPPTWSLQLTRTAQIGHHVFFR